MRGGARGPDLESWQGALSLAVLVIPFWGISGRRSVFLRFVPPFSVVDVFHASQLSPVVFRGNVTCQCPSVRVAVEKKLPWSVQSASASGAMSKAYWS